MKNPADQSSDLVTLFAPMWIWDGKFLDGIPPALYSSPFSAVYADITSKLDSFGIR